MVRMANFERLVCGGYFLVKRVPRPKDVSDPAPDVILTVSSCFTDVAPDTWTINGYGLDDQEQAAEASKFGIPAAAVPELVTLMSLESDGFPYAFPTLSIAQRFWSHCVDKTDVTLVGIGLDPKLVPSVYSQRDKEVNHGLGLLDYIRLERSLSSGGEPLGYEPLGFDGMRFHSWLCHDAPKEALERFGIRPNQHGFIITHEDAVYVTEYVVATGAEPAIWEPWLVVKYGERQRE
jgi:hypothetical protein